MHCNGSITIMWSLNVFINDFTLPCLQVKKFCQVIRVCPAHSLKQCRIKVARGPKLKNTSTPAKS